MRFSFAGLKSTVISLLAQVALFTLAFHTQSYWQSKLSLLNVATYGLLLVTALLGAQFKRSRLAFSCGLCLVFLALSEQRIPLTSSLALSANWSLLFGAGLLTQLSFSQDRGLWSVHTPMRLIVFALCGVICFGWLWLIERYSESLAALPLMATFNPYLALHLPLSLLFSAMLYRAVSLSGLTHSALLGSFILWLGLNQQMIPLPLTMTLLILSLHYLLCILIESYFLAYRDDLTGLPTRRALNQLALSLGRKYTVAMLDIDHFKKFNDTYGHDIGDQVLKLVASKISGVKGGGRVFRYGGEEFTLVFPGKTPAEAIPALEQLRQTIADYQMVVRTAQRSNKKARGKGNNSDSKTVSVTVSIGVAQRQPKQSFDECLKQADMALYRAKKAGRNKVCE